MHQEIYYSKPSDKLKNKLGVAIIRVTYTRRLLFVYRTNGGKREAISLRIYCSRAVFASYSKELLVIVDGHVIVRL